MIEGIRKRSSFPDSGFSAGRPDPEAAALVMNSVVQRTARATVTPIDDDLCQAGAIFHPCVVSPFENIPPRNVITFSRRPRPTFDRIRPFVFEKILLSSWAEVEMSHFVQGRT